jgi:hypothetical protein
MEIKTKFGIGDNVLFLINNQVKSDVIIAFNIFVNDRFDYKNNKHYSVKEIEYLFIKGKSDIDFPYDRNSENHYIIAEDKLFIKKSDLLKSL